MSNTKKNEELFVQIEYPIEFRKDLLESSRDTIRLFQKLEKIRLIRIQKEKEILTLKRQLNEIKKILMFLKSKLPNSESILIEYFGDKNQESENYEKFGKEFEKDGNKITEEEVKEVFSNLNKKKKENEEKNKEEKTEEDINEEKKKQKKKLEKNKKEKKQISSFLNEENKMDLKRLEEELLDLENRLSKLKEN